MTTTETHLEASQRIKERTFHALQDLMGTYHATMWSQGVWKDDESILQDLKDLDLIIEGILWEFPRSWMYWAIANPLDELRHFWDHVPGRICLQNQEDILDLAEETFNLVK